MIDAFFHYDRLVMLWVDKHNAEWLVVSVFVFVVIAVWTWVVKAEKGWQGLASVASLFVPLAMLIFFYSWLSHITYLQPVSKRLYVTPDKKTLYLVTAGGDTVSEEYEKYLQQDVDTSKEFVVGEERNPILSLSGKLIGVKNAVHRWVDYYDSVPSEFRSLRPAR